MLSGLRTARRAFSSTSGAAARAPIFPRLLRLGLGGELAAWERAGFARNADADDVALSLPGGVDVGVARAMQGAAPSWGWADGPQTRAGSDKDIEDLAEDAGYTEVAIDGIQTSIDDLSAAECEAILLEREELRAPHPNGADGLYSITIQSPDLRRTVDALEGQGLELRRVLDKSPWSDALSMAFFHIGLGGGERAIVEVIAPSEPGEAVSFPGFFSIEAGRDAPARINGLLLRAPQLETLAEVVGAEYVGRSRPAVQVWSWHSSLAPFGRRCYLPTPHTF